MKIPCTTCGALILPATAQATDGVCMPCKHGFRAQIEESKQFYRIWKKLDCRVHETANGFSGLSLAEQIAFAVSEFNDEVMIGGVHNYFRSDAAKYHVVVMDGLTELGLSRVRRLLLRAQRLLFPECDPPADVAVRRRMLATKTEHEMVSRPELITKIDRIERALCREFWCKLDLFKRHREYTVRLASETQIDSA